MMLEHRSNKQERQAVEGTNLAERGVYKILSTFKAQHMMACQRSFRSSHLAPKTQKKEV